MPRIDITRLGNGHDRARRPGRVTAVSGIVLNGQWAAALKTYSRDVAHAPGTESASTVTAKDAFAGRWNPAGRPGRTGRRTAAPGSSR